MKLDRSAIMKRAHRDFKYWRRVGEHRMFGECLRNAWQVARVARDSGSMKYSGTGARR